MRKLKDKLYFLFHTIWSVFGSLLGLFFLLLSVVFVSPVLLFLAIISFGAGIVVSLLFWRNTRKEERAKEEAEDE